LTERGEGALTPEQGADATGVLLGLIGLGQDTLFVFTRKDASLGSGDDLGVGAIREGENAFVVFVVLMLCFLPALLSN
jgi:hypothetical protein